MSMKEISTKKEEEEKKPKFDEEVREKVDEEVRENVVSGSNEELKENEDSDKAVSEIKVMKAFYTMDKDKQVKRLKINLERETYEIKVEQTPKGGATNITMNPAPFLILLKHLETVRPGQKSRIGKVTATVKENIELREAKGMKVHTKIVMEMQLSQSPGAKTKPTVHLFPGDSKVEIQGSNAAQERAANEYFVPLLKKLLKGNEVVVEKIMKAIAETKDQTKKRKPKHNTLDCNLCECKFISEIDLRGHRARIHAITLVSPTASPPSKKEKPNEDVIYIPGKCHEEFECDVCASKYENKNEMDSHMANHQDIVELEEPSEGTNDYANVKNVKGVVDDIDTEKMEEIDMKDLETVIQAEGEKEIEEWLVKHHLDTKEMEKPSDDVKNAEKIINDMVVIRMKESYTNKLETVPEGEEEKEIEEDIVKETTVDDNDQELLNFKAFEHLIKIREFKDQGTNSEDLQLEAYLHNKAELESLKINQMQLEIDYQYLSTEKEIVEADMERELDIVKTERDEVRQQKEEKNIMIETANEQNEFLVKEIKKLRKVTETLDNNKLVEDLIEENTVLKERLKIAQNTVAIQRYQIIEITKEEVPKEKHIWYKHFSAEMCDKLEYLRNKVKVLEDEKKKYTILKDIVATSTEVDENIKEPIEVKSNKVELNHHKSTNQNHSVVEASPTNHDVESNSNKCEQCLKKVVHECMLMDEDVVQPEEQSTPEKIKPRESTKDKPSLRPTVMPKSTIKPIESTEFICKICKLVRDSKEKMERHMMNHCEESLWTCDDCDFQTDNMMTLSNHLNLEQHTAQSLNLSVRGTKCNFCEDRFSTDKEMWAHRKSRHGTFKPCRNLPDCSFGAECYYSHVTMKLDFRCFECGTEFKTNNDMMVHRHIKHRSTKLCTKFANGTCRRSSQECWWSHSTNGSMQPSHVKLKPTVVGNNSPQPVQGFWGRPANLAPTAWSSVVANKIKPNPETLMMNMMGLMQQLMMSMTQA